jgi:hypothetical protein
MPGTLQEALRISEIIHRVVEMENKEKNLKKYFHSGPKQLNISIVGKWVT